MLTYMIRLRYTKRIDISYDECLYEHSCKNKVDHARHKNSVGTQLVKFSFLLHLPFTFNIFILYLAVDFMTIFRC